MNQKFLIVFFVTIFYNGVTSAPLESGPISVGNIPEEKPPTVLPVTADHINKKVESTTVPTADHEVLKSSLHHSKIPTISSTTAHPDANNKNSPVTPNITDSRNVTQNDKNITAVNSRNVSLVTDGKNMSHPIDNESTSPASETKNSVAPVIVPGGTNSSVVTTKPVRSSVIPTTAAPTIPTATPVSTISSAKPDVTTVVQKSTGISNVVVEHNTPAPVEEKHFHGPSFIGGIVLTVGVTAIGFIAFKYYKSGKIDMNYRTL